MSEAAMARMLAAQLVGVEQFAVEEIARPAPGPGEVLVRATHTGICGTDIHIFRGEFSHRVKYPAVLGHEFGGIIAALGQGVSEESGGGSAELRVGARCAVDPLVFCGRCPACAEGQFSACQQLKLLGVDLPGGHGEYAVAAAKDVFPVPAGFPPWQTALCEVYAVGCHAVSRAGIVPGDTVVLLGAGKLGLAILDVLLNTAAGEVLAVDVLPERLEAAKKLGASQAIRGELEDPVQAVREHTGGRGADCVFEAVGHWQETPFGNPVEQAVLMLRPGGRLVLLGQGRQKAAVPFRNFVWKEAVIIASRVSRGEFPRAIKLLAQGRLHPELLVTHRLPLTKVQEAFRLVADQIPGVIKVQLEHQEN